MLRLMLLSRPSFSQLFRAFVGALLVGAVLLLDVGQPEDGGLHAQVVPPLELVAEHGGRIGAVAVDGALIAVAVHSRVALLDGDAAPGLPPLAVSVPLGAPIRALAARDGWLLAIGHDAHMIDARDPRHPRVVARVSLLARITEAVWVGAEGWLLSEDGAVHRLDLRDPAAPQLRPEWRPLRSPRGLEADLLSLAPIGDGGEAERAAVLALWQGDRGSTRVLLVARPDPEGGAPIEESRTERLSRAFDRVLTSGSRWVLVHRCSGDPCHVREGLRQSDGRLAIGPDLDMAIELAGSRAFALEGRWLWSLAHDGRVRRLDLDQRALRTAPYRADLRHNVRITARPKGGVLVTGEASALWYDAGLRAARAALGARDGYDLALLDDGVLLHDVQGQWARTYGPQGALERFDPPPPFDAIRTKTYGAGNLITAAQGVYIGAADAVGWLPTRAGGREAVRIPMPEVSGLRLLDARAGRLALSGQLSGSSDDAWVVEHDAQGAIRSWAPLEHEAIELPWIALSARFGWWMEQTSGGMQLRAFDLLEPGRPQAVGEPLRVPLGNGDADGDLLALAAGVKVEILRADVTGRTAISPLSTIPVLGVAADTALEGRNLWVLETGAPFPAAPATLSLFDLQRPEQPKLVGAADVTGRRPKLVAEEDRLWLLDDGAIQVYRAPWASPLPTATPAPARPTIPDGWARAWLPWVQR